MPLDIISEYDPNRARADDSRARAASDHNAAGFYRDGPQLARPAWVRLVPSGEAIPSDEAPSRVHARTRALAASRARSQRIRREAWDRVQRAARAG